MTKSYYVIPDIHGANDLLQKALTHIYEKEPEGCKIIFLGDYIDRGPDNVGVLKTVMNPPEKYEFITLMGNHEDMFIDGYFRESNYYDYNALNEIMDSDLELDKVVDWMRLLRLYHVEGENIFAHAWINPDYPLEEQVSSEVLWARMSDAELYDSELYLTHGHTPRKHGPTKAINRCNLDCGAVFYGRLVIARYEKDRAGPVEFVEFYK